MFTVCIIPNNTTSNLSLCYKEHKDALFAFNRMKAADLSIEETDDYGNVVFIPRDNVAYFLFIDVKKSEERQFDQQMCVNAARQTIESKLVQNGYKAQKVNASPIIQ